MTQRTMLTLSSNQRSKRPLGTDKIHEESSVPSNAPKLLRGLWISRSAAAVSQLLGQSFRSQATIKTGTSRSHTITHCVENHINAWAVASAWQIDKTSHLHHNCRPREPIDHSNRNPRRRTSLRLVHTTRPAGPRNHPAGPSGKPGAASQKPASKPAKP
jgi:hypothetical protein